MPGLMGFDPIPANMGVPFGYESVDGGGGGGGGTEITVSGTEGSCTGSDFTFKSGSSSNVKFKVDGDGSIVVDVYYV